MVKSAKFDRTSPSPVPKDGISALEQLESSETDNIVILLRCIIISLAPVISEFNITIRLGAASFKVALLLFLRAAYLIVEFHRAFGLKLRVGCELEMRRLSTVTVKSSLGDPEWPFPTLFGHSLIFSSESQ